MTLLDDKPIPPVRRERLALVLQVAGLVLTGWVLWGARLLMNWRHVPVVGLLVQSAMYAVAACAAGAAITLVLYLTAMQWGREEVVRATLRTSSAAVWFAPAVILLMEFSPAGIAAAIVLVVNATRLLYHEWVQQPGRGDQAPPGFAISLSAQLGLVALMFERPLMASLCFAVSAAMVTVAAIASRGGQARPPQSLPRAMLGVLLTIVLAIGLTMGGMIPGLMFRGGGGGPRAAARDLPKIPDTALADGGFPGVILWPEVKPYATLIAPMLQRQDGLATVESRPMSIPFSGEYWLFRWPFARPPKTSLRQRGTPSSVSFRTTDHRPLQMEARHKFDQAIALSCCRSIDMAIRNTDRYPNTISLELVLIDNEPAGAREVSLGQQTVRSRPDLKRDPPDAVLETLHFAVPAVAPIHAFDELKIVFYRDRSRVDQSAKVAIDRFILVP